MGKGGLGVVLGSPGARRWGDGLPAPAAAPLDFQLLFHRFCMYLSILCLQGAEAKWEVLLNVSTAGCLLSAGPASPSAYLALPGTSKSCMPGAPPPEAGWAGVTGPGRGGCSRTGEATAPTHGWWRPLEKPWSFLGDGCAACPSCWKASPSPNLESEAGRDGAWKPGAGAAHPPEGMVQTPQLSPAEGTPTVG